MAGPKVEVQITGDASGLSRAFGDAASSASSFGSKMASVGKVAGLALAAGVGVATVAAVSFAKAALDAEKSQTRLDAAFQHANTSAKERAAAMKAVNDISVKSGLDDEDLADSLARLTQVTGNSTKATADLAIAADIARAKGVSLEAATGIVTKAALGNLGALKRQGIEIPRVTAAQDALKASGKESTDVQLKAAKAADELATRQGALSALQAKYAGDAEKYGQTASGAMDRFKVAIENVQEGLGTALLPALASAAGGVADFLDKFNQAEGAGEKFKVVMDTVKTVASDAWNALVAGFNAINWGSVWDTVSSKAVAGVGKLGTAIKSAIGAVDWKAAVSDAGRLVGEGLVTALDKLGSFISKVNWNAVGSEMIKGLGKAIGAIALFLASVDWGAVIGKMISLMVSVIRAQVGILLGIATTLGGAIVKGVIAGLQGIANFVWDKLQALAQTVARLASQLYGAALNVGKQIVQGIGDGIGALWGWLLGKAGSLVSAVKDKLEFWKSPADAYGRWIGGMLVGGIGEGMAAGTGEAAAKAQQVVVAIKTALGDFKGVGETVTAAMLGAVGGALDAAKALIESRKGEFESAFGSLSSAITSAFATITGNIKTPAEKQLAQIEKTNKEAALLQAESDAGVLLANAKTNDELLAAEAAYAKAEQDIQIYNLEQQAANERIQQNAINAVRSESLQTMLTTLGTQLANGTITYQQWNTRVQQLLSSFIPGWQARGSELGQAVVNALQQKKGAADTAAAKLGQAHSILAGYVDEFSAKGKKLGQAFAEGLAAKVEEVRGAAAKLAQAASINAKVTVSVATGGGADGARAAGGPVRAGGRYLVGEEGPELFVPKTGGMIVPNGGGMRVAGGGGIVVNVNTGNVYGNGGISELSRRIREEIQRTEARNR